MFYSKLPHIFACTVERNMPTIHEYVFNYLKAVVPLQGVSLLWNSKSTGVFGISLIDRPQKDGRLKITEQKHIGNEIITNNIILSVIPLYKVTLKMFIIIHANTECMYLPVCLFLPGYLLIFCSTLQSSYSRHHKHFQ